MAGVNEASARWTGPDAAAEPARAKLFTHGGSQAVRLPKAFRFEGSEVVIRKEGNRVVLEPVPVERVWPTTEEGWKAFWAEFDARRGPDLIPYPPRDHLTWSDPE